MINVGTGCWKEIKLYRNMSRKTTYKEFLNELLLKNPSYLDDKVVINQDELLSLPSGKFLKEKTIIFLPFLS